MKLYLYSENCTRQGAVYQGPDPEENGDLFAWGEGTEEELAAQARERLSQRTDTRPGGAGDAFAHRCCRSVLEYLGVEEAR